jgi:signal transduction histidine kinase
MFRRILLWFVGMLVFSFLAYLATSILLSSRGPERGALMRQLLTYQTNHAVQTYEQGGPKALAELLKRTDTELPARHHLLDRTGRDLANGRDLSELLNVEPRKRRFLLPPSGRVVIKRTTDDGKYNYVVEYEARGDPLANLPVYGWIVLVIVLLCYVLAWTLAKPVRQLRESMVRFGRGDLSARANFRRNDELGDLARAFDLMADRIQTLLTAERRLLQDISHELRSPLARLRFAVELARSNAPNQPAFNRVTKEVERLATLVGELLQVTRAEGDVESRNIADIDLSALLESIVDDCQIEAEARNCTIDLLIPNRIFWPGDKELVHRAFENVLRNAIAHTPEGSVVEVDLRVTENQVICRIRDYGPGVPDDQLSEIFRPFFRVEEDRNRENGGGVGLGLAIAERAIRVHHGQILAHNVQPGLLIELKLPR